MAGANPNTQAYITLAVVEAAKRGAIRNALGVYLQQLGAWQASIANQVQAMNAALLTETDEQMRQHLEHEKQTLLALRREVSDVERQTTELGPVLIQQERYQSAFANDAVKAGYVV